MLFVKMSTIFQRVPPIACVAPAFLLALLTTNQEQQITIRNDVPHDNLKTVHVLASNASVCKEVIIYNTTFLQLPDNGHLMILKLNKLLLVTYKLIYSYSEE